MRVGDLLGALVGLLRAIRFVGIFQRGGSTAARLVVGLGLFAALGMVGGASLGTAAGAVVTLLVIGWVGYQLVRTYRRVFG